MKSTNTKKTYKAQILVIVLIALAIISIFVVVVATNARRDVIESVQNKQYEQALSQAEEALLSIVEGDLDILDPSKCANLTPPITLDQSCSFAAEPQPGFDPITIEIKAKPTSYVENLTIEKDKSFRLNLNDYNDVIHMRWTGSVSWMVTIDYEKNTPSGTFASYKDVFDHTDYTPNFFDTESNCMNFLYNPTDHELTFNIDSLETGCGLSTDIYYYKSLRLKPLMNGQDSTVLTLYGTNLPEQVVKYTATGRFTSPGLADAPVAQVELVKPIYNEPIELLDYVLRTETKISK